MPSRKNVEHERKFIVKKKSAPPLRQYSSRLISQGYLVLGRNGGPQVRVREIRHGSSRATEHVITLKSGRGTRRTEVELHLSRDQFLALWPLTKGRRLRKRRYDVPWGKFTIEVDCYQGELSGLCVAEVEFDSPKLERAFRPPSWLGRDVSDLSRYGNQTLATKGFRGKK